MKIVIPAEKDMGMATQVSPHFGMASMWAVYNSETKELKFEKKQEHAGNCASLEDVAEMKPDILFVTGMGHKAMDKCRAFGLCIKTGPCGTVQEIADNVDRLEDFSQACLHHSHHH